MHCCLAEDGLMLATGSDWLAMVGIRCEQLDHSRGQQLVFVSCGSESSHGAISQGPRSMTSPQQTPDEDLQSLVGTANTPLTSKRRQFATTVGDYRTSAVAPQAISDTVNAR